MTRKWLRRETEGHRDPIRHTDVHTNRQSVMQPGREAYRKLNKQVWWDRYRERKRRNVNCILTRQEKKGHKNDI